MNQPERGARDHRVHPRRRAAAEHRAAARDGLRRRIRTCTARSTPGIPLVNPQGGYYFVFQTGEPRFRKYDARGTLLFERVIQGSRARCLARVTADDVAIATRRARDARGSPIVRTAAVDPCRQSLDRVHAAVHVRLRRRRREEPRRAVSRRGHHRAHEPVVRAGRHAAGHARLLRVRPAAGHRRVRG